MRPRALSTLTRVHNELNKIALCDNEYVTQQWHRQLQIDPWPGDRLFSILIMIGPIHQNPMKRLQIPEGNIRKAKTVEK
jgi:hypothetical protein